MSTKDNTPWSIEEFERRLRAKDKSYHIHHPFHIAMNGGECTKEQVQGWVLNRFYYQIMIPIKDGAILSNMPDKEHRKLWIQRINAAARIEGVSYSRLMGAMTKQNIEINRKVLADLAVNHPEAFKAVLSKAMEAAKN